jgi:hypothetical protein
MLTYLTLIFKSICNMLFDLTRPVAGRGLENNITKDLREAERKDAD